MHKCFSNLSGHNHYCKCSERKVYNRSFGTETPIPHFSFQKDIFYTRILCSCHSRCPHFLSWLFLHKKLCNRGFGTETPIPQFPFKTKPLLRQFHVDAIAAILTVFYGCFLEESCGIGVLVPKSLFHNFLSRNMQERK